MRHWVRVAPIRSSARRFAALAAIAMLLAAGWSTAVSPSPSAAATTTLTSGFTAATTTVSAIRLSCKDAPSANGQTVSRKATIKVGTVLRITLCAVGSDGGYEWAKPRYDSDALAFLGKKILPPTGPAGSSGSVAWRFRALTPSSSTITFADRRTFDGRQAILKVVVTVRVTS